MDVLINELRPIFSSVFDVDGQQITAATTARDIPQWDSLHHVQLIMEIEETFNIQFDLEELTQFENVGDIASAIERKR
jgi:acyl carrier protein